jgi:anti-anti-sigma factor
MDTGFDVREKGGVTILDVRGALVRGPSCDGLLRAVAQLLDTGQARLVLNLSELTFFDSIGMSTLMKAVVAAEERGARLRLVRPEEMASSPATLGPLEMCADEEEALASFNSLPLH